jgi:hypothetical protein
VPFAESIDISGEEGGNRYFQVLTTITNDDGLATPALSAYTINFETSGSDPTPTPSSSTLSPSPSSAPDISELPASGFLDWFNPFSKNKTNTEKIIYWLVLPAIIAPIIYLFIKKKRRAPK